MTPVRPFTEDCERARRTLLAAMREKKAKDEAFQAVRHRFGSGLYERRLRESIAADEAAERARAAMLLACDDESSRIDLPSGTKVIVHARSDPLEVERILQVLEQEIPPDDLAGLDTIHLKGEPSDRRIDVPVGGSTTEPQDVNGDYTQTDSGRGIIRDYFPHAYRTIKHEIGHHVFHMLTPERRTEWKTRWQRLKDRGKLPNDYAGKNENEGFAELYEYFRNRLDLDADALEAFTPFVRPNPKPVNQDEGE